MKIAVEPTISSDYAKAERNQPCFPCVICFIMFFFSFALVPIAVKKSGYSCQATRPKITAVLDTFGSQFID